MDRIRNLAALFRAQLWPVPALFMACAVALAYVLLEFGAAFGTGGHWWLYSGDAATARDLLGSLLSGMMTMTSLVVSVTFVILTLAANQLGPRLIAIFMADRQIQSVLGLFIATILYIILVLRTLNDTLGADGVPQLAVSAASGATILCLLALLFYIHKVARLIIADNVVAIVARDFRSSLRTILPDEKCDQPVAEAVPGPGSDVSIGRSGYVQVVDYDALLACAEEEGCMIQVHVRAGHHVLDEGRHLTIYGKSTLTDGLIARMQSAFTIGDERTPAQDGEHGIRQLVEIATRALSPGTNDPFTAIAVIDRLGPVLEDVVRLGTQPTVLSDAKGRQRLHVDRSDLTGILAAAINPVRQAGAAHPAILIRLASMLRDLAYVSSHREASALRGQLHRLEETLETGTFPPSDRKDVQDSIDAAMLALAVS